MIILAAFLSAGGCIAANNWRLNDYSERSVYPASDASGAMHDESRVIGFLPSIGFKKVETPASSQPVTEAVFIRGDNDHFHITITVRALCRLDQPGWATVVNVVSYNIGEEGSYEAGRSAMNEIDQLYRKGQ